MRGNVFLNRSLARMGGRVLAVGALLLLQFVAACIEYKPQGKLPTWPDSEARPLDPTTREDVTLQTVTPIVDVLWTIDNSCSMKDEQDSLAAYFPVFMEYFDGSGLDYHVGVISTDLDNPQHAGKLQGSNLDGDRLTPPEYKFIDVNTPDPVTVFQTMATLGTNGTGAEKGLGAIYLALEQHRDSYNAGYFRDEASIHTVVISDEKDHTDDTIVERDEFIEWYRALKIDYEDRTFSCITHLDGFNRGDEYIRVANQVGGIVWSIDAGDWVGVLDRLGVQASGLKREYFLSDRPVPGTIEVEVHDPSGTVLPFGESQTDPPTDGWVYDARRNSITFVEFIPEPLSRVVIRYTLLSSLDSEGSDSVTLNE